MVLEKSTEETDNFKEHIDPIDILSQLSKDFYEKLEAKQWQERKETIEMLEGILMKAQKLEGGEYGELVRAIKRVRKPIHFLILCLLIIYIHIFAIKT